MGKGLLGLTTGGKFAGEEQQEALNRGMSERKASALGTLSGAAEGVMNTIGFNAYQDKFMKQGAKTAIDILRNMGVAGLTNAAENAAQFTGNEILDSFIGGEQGRFKTDMNEAIANGMSEKDAEAYANKNMQSRIASQIKNGFIMGGLLGGVSSINTPTNRAKLDNMLGESFNSYGRNVPSLDKTDKIVDDIDSATLQRNLMEQNNVLLNRGRALLGEEPIEDIQRESRNNINFVPGDYKNVLRNKEITRADVISKTSTQFQDALNKLSNDEDVNIEAIENTPEVIYGYQNAKSGKSVDDIKNGVINREERMALQSQLADDYYARGSAVIDENGKARYDGVVDKGKTAVFVTGLPASGKSTTLVNPISEYFHARVLDSDDIKEQLPEFNNGFGANYVHKESKEILRKVTEKAIMNDENVVIPIVGGDDVADLVTKLREYQDAGYRVAVCQNDLPSNKAVGRALSRYATDGRFIPPDVLKGYGNTPQENYLKLLERSSDYGIELSGYARVNNDVAEGETARLLEYGGILEGLFGESSGSRERGQSFYEGIDSQKKNTITSAKANDINSIRQQIKDGKYEEAYYNLEELMASETASVKEVQQAESLYDKTFGKYLDEDEDIDSVIDNLTEEYNRKNPNKENNVVMAEDTGISNRTREDGEESYLMEEELPRSTFDDDGIIWEEEYVPYGTPAKSGSIAESRGITNTARKNELYDGLVKQETDELSSHVIQSNKETFDRAYNEIDTDEKAYEAELAFRNGEANMGDSAVDMTKGMLILHDLKAQYEDAIENGDTTQATTLNVRRTLLLRKFKEATENVGRTLQSLSMWTHSKEGAELAAESVRNKRTQEWKDKHQKQTKEIDNLSSKLIYAFNKLVEPEKVQVEGKRLNLDENMAEVVNTINQEMSSFAKHFSDEDVRYIANLLNNGVTKEELADFVATKMATGSFGLSDEVMNEVNRLFEENTQYNVNSKQFVENETEAYRLIANEICANANVFEKFNAWRYLAMLGNPKTMVRNAIGNKLFGAITEFSDNLSALGEAGVDRIAKKFNNGEGIERHKTVLTTKDSDLVKKSKADADENRYRQLQGDKYHDNVKTDIEKNHDVWNTKAMRGVENLVGKGLSDYKAAKNKYGKSLARYLKANGMDANIFDTETRFKELDAKCKAFENENRLFNKEETNLLKERDSLKDDVKLLQKARDFAQKEAEYAVFHEDNAVAQALTKFSNATPLTHVLTEGLIPFKKTPANILRSGIEYSPLGVGKSVADTVKFLKDIDKADTYTHKSKFSGKQVEKTKVKAADVIDSWSKTFTGTGLFLLGSYLFDKGLLHSSTEDEKYQDQLEGLQNYSIKLGDYTATIDFLAPAVMPLLVGAEYKRAQDSLGVASEDFWNEKNIAKLANETVNIGTSILSPIMETSMLSGVADTLDELARAQQSNDNANPLGTLGWNLGTGYISQTVPTLFGQAARTIDNTRRSTYSDKEGVSRTVDRQITKMENKIPFLSMKNEAYVDARGQEQINGFNTGNKALDTVANAAYQFASPTYIDKVETTKADELAREVYEATGDSDVFADLNTSKKINDVNGEKVKLSKTDYTAYAKLKGESNNTLREMLADDERLEGMTDAEKRYALKQINTLSDLIGEANLPDYHFETASDVYEAFAEGGYEGALDKILTDAHRTVSNNELKDMGIDRNDTTREMLDNNDTEGLERYAKAEAIAKDMGRDSLTETQWKIYDNKGEAELKKSLAYENRADDLEKKYQDMGGGKISNTKAFREACDKGEADRYAKAYKAITSTQKGLDDYGDPEYLSYTDKLRTIYETQGVAGLKHYAETSQYLDEIGLEKGHSKGYQNNLEFAMNHNKSTVMALKKVEDTEGGMGAWIPVLLRQNISDQEKVEIIKFKNGGVAKKAGTTNSSILNYYANKKYD